MKSDFNSVVCSILRVTSHPAYHAVLTSQSVTWVSDESMASPLFALHRDTIVLNFLRFYNNSIILEVDYVL